MRIEPNSISSTDGIGRTSRFRRPRGADLVAGVSIAGLLLPEAVAYSGIAGMPPQAGVVALFAGLLVYGIFGSSRFAIVSATSSSAAVLFASVSATAGVDVTTRIALGAGVVLLAGVFFVVAGLARLGAVSSLIAKPVLRGFALGLALTIVVKQLPQVLSFHPPHGDFFRLLYGLVEHWRQWNLAGAAMAVTALAFLQYSRRWRAVPSALIVIVVGIALDAAGFSRQWGVAPVGRIALDLSHPGLPALDRAQWLRLAELAFAVALILYAESYGSIRTFAVGTATTYRPTATCSPWAAPTCCRRSSRACRSAPAIRPPRPTKRPARRVGWPGWSPARWCCWRS